MSDVITRVSPQQEEVVMRSPSRSVLIRGLLSLFLMPVGLSAQMTIGIGGGPVSTGLIG